MKRTLAALLSLACASSVFAATTGIVFSTAGEPVAGAQVVAYRPESAEAQRARLAARGTRAALGSTTTDEQGAFTIDAKVTGVLELVATRDGYAPARDLALAGDDVVFELRPAKTRAVRVTANGKPVADALVAAFSQESAIWQARSDARGEVVIPEPKGWVSTLAVLHPDFAPYQEEARIDGGVTLNVVLTAGERVTGTVVTAKGAPAANAQLLVNGWLAGTAGADGKFVLPHVRSDAAVIAAVAGGAAGRAPRAGKNEIAIRLGEPRSIAGSVRDAGKRPLPGAYVIASTSRTAPATTIADEKGNYVLDALGAADFQVIVNATQALQFEEARVNLVQTAAGRADFTATAGNVVRGIVVDERKRPIAGATVQLSVTMMPPVYAFVSTGQASSAKTGRDGRFALPVDPQFAQIAGMGTQLRLQALRHGYAVAVTESLDPRADRKAMTIVLRDGLELSGTVVDSDGKPLAGAGVVAMEEPFGAAALPLEGLISGGMGQPFVETGPDGRFTMRVNEKPHDLGVWKETYAAGRAGSVMPDGKPLKIVLERGAAIRGKVVRKGSPASRLEGMVIARSDDGGHAFRQIEADGSFAFDSLRAGEYTIAFQSMGGEDVEKTVTAPADGVELELPPVTEIRGRVLDEQTGEPLTVDYIASAGTDGFLGENFPAGEPFTLPAPAGSTTVTVQARGYAPQSQNVTVEEGKPLELTFKLTRGRTISGRVREENGTPVAKASIAITDDAQYSTADSPRTGDDGAFALTGAPREAVTLQIGSERHIPRRVEVPAGDDDPRLEVVLSRGVKARGRVLSSEGQPVENASVDAVPSEGADGFRQAKTDSSGAFEMEGLSPGLHDFSARREDLGSAEIENVDPAAAEIVITMKPAGAMGSLHGKVAGFSGAKWQYGMVLTDRQEAMAMINRDGTFRIERVPAGEATVRAMFTSIAGDRGSTPAVTVTVVAGADTEVNLALRDDIVVRGVVTEGGRPVARRQVVFQNESGFWSGRTSESGEYAVSGMEPGLYQVWIEDRLRSFSTKLQVTGSATFDIRIEFTRLAGRVVDSAGAPIAGADIQVTGEDDAEATSAKTDANGAFDLSVQKGTYTVTASREGFLTAARRTVGDGAPLTITLARGGALPVKLVDARSGRFLSGYVVAVDAEGVLYRPSETKNNVHNLPVGPGAYRVSASADGYASQSVRVTVPANAEVLILLTPGGKLIIRTERAASELVKLAMPGGEEYVQCHCNGIAEIRLTGTTTTVEHVAPGAYTLRVLDERGRVKASYPVTIAEGQTTVAEVHVPE